MKRLLIFLLVILMALAISGCDKDKDETIAAPVSDDEIQPVLYNFRLDSYEYSRAQGKLDIYESYRETETSKPDRYLLYEDYKYVWAMFPDLEVHTHLTYKDGKTYSVYCENMSNGVFYKTLDSYMSRQLNMQQPSNGFEEEIIDIQSNVGCLLPDVRLLSVGRDIVRERFIGSEYRFLPAFYQTSDKLINGTLISTGVKDKVIYADIAYDNAAKKPTKCAIYDDIVKLFYDKYKMQSCDFVINIYMRAEMKFGETTYDYIPVTIHGTDDSHSKFYTKLKNHEAITYNDVDSIISYTEGPYDFVTYDIDEKGYGRLQIKY